MSHVASRRGFLAALAAFTGAGTTGAVAASTAISDSAQPDAELIVAERRWKDAVAFLQEVEARARTAARAEEAAMGPCPPALLVDHDADRDLVRLGHKRETLLRWENWHAVNDSDVRQSWSGPALRAAIAAVPGFYGRGGRTPHVIRRLRQLLPLAEARDDAEERAARRFGSEELYEAVPPAREAVDAAEERILAVPAATLVGIGVKARFAKHWLLSRRAGQDPKHPDCMMAVLGAALDVSGSPVEPWRPA